VTESDGAPGRIDRRELLGGVAAGAGTATMMWFWVEGFGDPRRRRRVRPTPPGDPPRTFTPDELATLAAAQDRLLPSEEGSPGARDVDAARYVDAVLAEPDVDPAFAVLVKDGARLLEERARARGAASFSLLAPEAQDAAIREFEATDAGVSWLRRTIYFTLEALLGDPVHGGNVGETGWWWLGHAPGSPRPTAPNWRPTPR
jgi:gluconate 2-dehydrogenase gamma chain